MATTFRPPRQARSSEGLERMLQAAESVLEERDFDEASLAEIAGRAGYTVGAFYARFRDKAALLAALEARVDAAVAGLARERLDPATWTVRPLRVVVRELLAASALVYRARRGSMRALVVRARRDPALRERLDERNRYMVGRFVDAVLARRGELSHPAPAAAAEFAVLIASSTLREVILFGDAWPMSRPVADDALVGELTRSTLRYLGAPEEAGTRA